jgi:CRP-like cAMP-binding protein
MNDSSFEIQKLRTILNKPPASRTSVEIQKLQLALQDIEFFRKLDREIARATCQNLTYEHLLGGELVFDQGEPGDAFYVILEGSVGVYVDDRLIDSVEADKVVINPLKYISKAYNFAKKDEKKASTPVASSVFATTPAGSDEITGAMRPGRKLARAQTTNFGARDLRQVATLSKGHAFGEMALQTDQPRAATVRALNELHLAKLDRSDYLKVIKSHYDKRNKEIFHFLKGVAIFNDWPDGKLVKLASMFVPKRLVRGQHVVNEGDPVNEIMFLQEGEYEIKKAFNKIVDVVSVVGAPSSLGLDEYVLGMETFNFSISCSSAHGVVLAIPMSKLTSRLAPEARDSLEKAAKQNAAFRDKRAHILGAVHAPRKVANKTNEAQQEWLKRLETLVDTLKSEYSVPGRLGAILEAEGKPGVDVFKFLAQNSDPKMPFAASPRASAILLHEGRIPEEYELNL